MRSCLILVVAAVLTMPLAAQQSNEQSQPPQNQPQKKQPQKQPAKEKEKKPEEPTAKNPEPAPGQPEQKPGDEKKDLHFDVTEVAPMVTHHQVTAEGKTLKYTATAGRLPIKRADGKIEAEMFFVAYTLDGQDSSKRPLTFAFNGGPGSASTWLHMGAL